MEPAQPRGHRINTGCSHTFTQSVSSLRTTVFIFIPLHKGKRLKVALFSCRHGSYVFMLLIWQRQRHVTQHKKQRLYLCFSSPKPRVMNVQRPRRPGRRPRVAGLNLLLAEKLKMRSQQMCEGARPLGAPSGAGHGILCLSQVCICVILGRAVTEWVPVLWLERPEDRNWIWRTACEVLKEAPMKREPKNDVIRDENLDPL